MSNRWVQAKLAAVCWATAATYAAGLYQCSSDVRLGPVRLSSRKGLAVDDVTLWRCTERVPSFWPNTGDQVKSLRLFKAWDPAWGNEGRWKSWHALRDFVHFNGARVLVGAQVTCSEQEDHRAWEWTKQLLRLLGPKHVMGLAIGNEIELLFTQPGVSKTCIWRMWEGGYYWRRLSEAVREFDDMGFQQVPVTSVFGGLALAGNPFFEVPGKALVNSFMQNATRLLGHRFVFTWNFYPYFDQKLILDPGTLHHCTRALGESTCWLPSCNVPQTLIVARQKMRLLTGTPETLLWIGETGWSSPFSNSLHTSMAHCRNWSSTEALTDFYQNFMQWDLSIGVERPPDHAFYFTLRDASNFKYGEHFGLIEGCADTVCKIRKKDHLELV